MALGVDSDTLDGYHANDFFGGYNVEDFGAEHDGATDDTASLQATFDAAANAGGGIVLIPGGTYRLTDVLNITSDAVRVQGQGRGVTVLRWSDNATKGIVVAGAATFAGSPLLTSNVAIGDRTVAVASATGLVVGGYAYFQDNDTYTGTFMTRIVAISGLTVTLEGAFPCALTTAQSAQLFSYAGLLDGITIRDLSLTTREQDATVSKLTLLEIRRCNNVLVTDVELDGTTAPCITGVANYRGRFNRVSCMNSHTVAGSGIELQSSTGVSIIDCDAVNCTFGFTPAESPYTRLINCRVNGRGALGAAQLGRGIRLSNNANFCAVEGCTVSDVALFGIYAQDCAHNVINGNVLNRIGVDIGEHGIAIGGFLETDCVHNVISNNVVHGARGAGIIASTALGGANLYTVITGNRVSGSYQRAMYLGSNRNTVTGNVLTADGATNFQCLAISNNSGYNVVTGNVFAHEGTTLQAISSAGLGNNIIGPNQYNGLALGLLASDTTFTTTALSQQPKPVFSTTSVSTGADTTETTAWTFTIPAALLTVNGQGFRLRASLTTAANGNTKTVKVYVGNEVLTGASGSSGEDIEVVFDVFRKTAGACFFMGHIYRVGISTAQSSLNGTVDWTGAVVIKITMTNGTASAGDITFNGGWCMFEGIPSTVFS